jgi:hypothetical protein
LDRLLEALERAYCNRHARHLDVDRLCSKLVVGRDALETLDHVQISELRGDRSSFAVAQQRRNGTLRAEQ